ncbi:MAG TPA: DUF1330 domain-containing protein [Terriglobales bacterium]|nr:DUF1330 domain-containing protein [Terriglobales bacterium]
MAKGYWVTVYHSVSNPTAFAEYGKLATTAIQARGGRFLVRGMPSKVYEEGAKERVVIIEFASVADAVSTMESPEYQAAKKVLGNSVKRDIRIVEGA